MPDDAVTLHAGVLALGNRTLWGLIVDFMSGYPFAVEKFYDEHKHIVDLLRDGRVGSLIGDGELLHLAIAANNSEMFKLLCKLREDNPVYEHDPKLCSTKTMRCAALYNRVGILECMEELKISTYSTGFMRVCLGETCPSESKDMMYNTQRGDLDVVRWLYERKPSITQSIVDEAAKRGHIHVLRYFYEHNARRYGHGAFNHAVYKGYLDVVKLIVANDINEMEGSSGCAIDSVARHGRLEMVEEFFVESGVKRSTVNEGDRNSMVALTRAAVRNDLELFKHLHSNLRAGESAYAMLEADALVNNHCIIEFLCTNQEREPMSFLKQAAAKGSVSVVGKILEAVSSIPTEELVDAMAFAFEQNQPAIGEFIESMIRLRAWRRVAQ